MRLGIDSTVKLNNGVNMPLLGLGVFQMQGGREALDSLAFALDVGYRHIDTAMIYENEKSVGEAIRRSGLPREEIFVTTKLWNTDHGYDRALRAFDESRRRLGFDYVDLYLIHWPVQGGRLKSWRALEKLLSQGLTRAIGVSNYMVRHLQELTADCSILPAVNQIELHPYNFGYRRAVANYCRAHDIRLEAYSPLVRGKKFDDGRLVDLAEKYRKTPAQILIRWALQEEVVVIPKSTRPARIKENADVFDFSLTDRDMALLRSFNEDLVICWDPTDIP